MCLLHYAMTTEHLQDNKPSNQENVRIIDILRVFKVNRPFVALCIHGVFICFMQYVTSTLSNYMYSAVLGDLALASYGTIISAPFMAIIFIFGASAAKKFGLERLIRISLLISSLIYVVLFIMHVVMDVNPWVHIIVSGVAMGIASISIYLQWGLVGEAIDYNEMITGKRTEGSIYGTFNLSRRVGQTIASSLAIYMLGIIGYDATKVVQSDATIFGLKTLCVLLPGILVLGSWVAFKFVWNIDENTRKKLLEFKTLGSEE